MNQPFLDYYVYVLFREGQVPFYVGMGIIIVLFFLVGWHDFGFIIRNGGVH